MKSRLSEQSVRQIEERNRERRARKARVTPGPWLYDSFAFLDSDPTVVPRKRQMCVLVRPRSWFDTLIEKHGSGILDEGLDTKDMQPYYDAEYIAQTRTDTAEDDIDALLQHIRSTQQ